MGIKKENFSKAVEWLFANGMAKDQADLSKITGVTETSISRILNCKVKAPSDKTLRKFNSAFNGIFNMDFLRGYSDDMFPVSQPSTVNHQPSTDFSPEQSKIVNTMIAAYDETIVSLKRELAAKDDTIETKDKLIELLEQQVKDLKTQLAKIKQEDISKYPFPVGFAEDGSHADTSIVK